jgi:TusA-related sulfurtransferase
VNPDLSPDLELDCRGMLCPRPIIELGRRHTEVPVGGLVAVVADDVAARVDVPAWCRMREQEYVGEDTADDGVPRYWVRRCGATSATASAP